MASSQTKIFRNQSGALTTQDVTERIQKVLKMSPDLKYHTIHVQYKGTEEIFDVQDVKIHTDGDDLYICLIVDDIEV